MKKNKVIFISVVIVILIIAFISFISDKNKSTHEVISGKRIFTQTHEYSKKYVRLRHCTNQLLNNASQYTSYES